LCRSRWANIIFPIICSDLGRVYFSRGYLLQENSVPSHVTLRGVSPHTGGHAATGCRNGEKKNNYTVMERRK